MYVHSKGTDMNKATRQGKVDGYCSNVDSCIEDILYLESWLKRKGRLLVKMRIAHQNWVTIFVCASRDGTQIVTETSH